MNRTPALHQWKRISRRTRVPLGFAFVFLYFWLARPTAVSILVSLIPIVPGILLRGYASGYVKKNSELTTTGPYAHTRNPLYLGSILIAFGFALAACSIWIAVALAVCFLAIYWPVILSEEEFLRAHFSDYEEYATRVPRLLPRIRGVKIDVPGAFSWQLYRKHREYNSLLGSVCLYAALTALVWFRHGR
jgi:protein-S-isoprenylcysteine O-methyltransferase Ste14